MLLQRYFDVSQATDVASLQRHLVEMAGELEFPLVSAMLVVEGKSPTSRPQVYYVGNMPSDFANAARDEGSVARDPVIRRMKQLAVPFIYDQALYVGEGAGDLWEEQAAFGYKTGIAVALHLPDHCHFMLGVDRETPLPQSDERLIRMMADLQLLAVHAQAAAGRLLPPQTASAEVVLTAREIEILKWTMEGKSAWSVGEIIGVSEHTVNFHLRKIFKKLDASSKHQAVLKAISAGLITPS